MQLVIENSFAFHTFFMKVLNLSFNLFGKNTNALQHRYILLHNQTKIEMDKKC